MLLEKMNTDPLVAGGLGQGAPAHSAAPVMATPLATIGAAAVAKAAGVVVGAGGITAAAYVAYKTAGG